MGVAGGDAARLPGGGGSVWGGRTKGFKFLDTCPQGIHTSPTLQVGLSQWPGSTPQELLPLHSPEGQEGFIE